MAKFATGTSYLHCRGIQLEKTTIKKIISVSLSVTLPIIMYGG